VPGVCTTEIVKWLLCTYVAVLCCITYLSQTNPTTQSNQFRNAQQRSTQKFFAATTKLLTYCTPSPNHLNRPHILITHLPTSLWILHS